MTDLKRENQELRAQLAEALDTLEALRSGAVDALVVSGEAGEQLYTLQGADHTYRILVEKMHEGALMLEANGAILYANARAAELLGAPLSRIMCSELADWVAPEQRERAQALLNRTSLPFSLELSIQRPDETTLSVECSSSALDVPGSPASIALVLTDLTERRRTEEILGQQRLFQAVFSQAAEAIVVVSPEGRILNANLSAERMVGRSGVGEQLDSVLPLLEGQGRAVSLEELANEVSSLRSSLQTDNRQFDLLVSSRRLTKDNDDLLALVMVLADITEVSRLTADLSRSEAEMRTTLYSIGDAVVATDRDGTVRLMNRAARTLTRWPEQDACGRPLGEVFRIINENTRESVADPVERVLATGDTIGLGNHTVLISRDSSEIPIADSAAPIRLDDGTITGAVLVFSDQTEQRRLEKQLRVEKERAQQYLDVAGVMLLALDNEGRVSRINPKGCNILGVSEEEIVDQDWIENFIPEDNRSAVRSVFERMVAGGVEAVETYENTVLRKDGSNRLISWHNSLLRGTNDEITGVFCSGEDVTETRNLRAKVAQADRMASMGTLAAGIAHELNNPLAYALYNVESLAEDLPPIVSGFLEWQARQSIPGQRLSPADLEDVIERAKSAAEGLHRIKSVARTLSTFARVEDDSLALVDVRQAIEHAKNLASNELKYRARLLVDIGKVPLVMGTESRLSQVFLNLLRNATEAIGEGSVEQNEIRITGRVSGGNLIVAIQDTGCGIPDESVERVFEPFYTTKDVGEGSGLGLTISSNIIQELEGDIMVESKVGEGSVFRVRLPIPPADRPSDTSAAVTLGLGSHTRRARILVVDDEAGIRRSITHMLRDHEVLTAASGLEGRRILERDQNFALLVLDLMMSEVSGMELHRWLTQTHAELAKRVIFVTGGAFTTSARAYLAEVDNDRFEKPLDTVSFKRVVAERVAQGLQTD